MKHRNPLVVFILPFITCGIYSWYWLVSTKNELNKLGASIPTAWIWLIPFIGSIWWLWKYSEGVDKITNGKLSGILVFLLFFLIGSIGHAIVQDSFNNLTAPSTPGQTPAGAGPPPAVNPAPSAVAPAPPTPQQQPNG
jgi:Domain of unknown function (DUF4234)